MTLVWAGGEKASIGKALHHIHWVPYAYSILSCSCACVACHRRYFMVDDARIYFVALMSAFVCCGPHAIPRFYNTREAQYRPSFFLIFSLSPLPLSCRLEFISNQRETDKRPILITLSFAYLHINDCRLCCFSLLLQHSPPARLPITTS